MTQKYAVIFDMDGVLVNSSPFHMEAWELFSAKYKCPINYAAFYNTFGMRNDEILPLLFPNRFKPEEFSRVDEEKEALYRQCIRGKVQPPEGLIEFMEALQEANIAMAIGSSGPRLNVELIINELHLNKYLKGFVCGGDVKKAKPHPDIFLKAAKKCNLDPQNCLVIEDAPLGVDAAIAAGMTSIGYLSTATPEALHKANHLISSFNEAHVQLVTKIIQENI